MSIVVEPHYAQQYVDTLQAAANELLVLQVISHLKPSFSIDGNKYCLLFGEFPNNCIVGFGDTPRDAMNDFYNNFHTGKVKSK